ncbi:MAG: hypothetical protein GXY83_43145 [Rhodopirellula sp.]|nr:hypothetical protein [Rhodopirellula sp.]
MRRRRFREVLALPRDDREAAIADQHIRQQTAMIRATWSEREHRRRAGLRPKPPPWEFPTIDARLLGEQ